MNAVPTAVMTTTAAVTSAIRSNTTNIHTYGGKIIIIIIIISKINIKIYYNNFYSYNWEFACSNLGSYSDYCKVIMGHGPL
jgi:hypothetical protein